MHFQVLHNLLFGFSVHFLVLNNLILCSRNRVWCCIKVPKNRKYTRYLRGHIVSQGPPLLCWFRGLYHYQQSRATTPVWVQGTALVMTGEHQCGGSERKLCTLNFLWWEPFRKTNCDANHTCKYFQTLGVICPKMHTTRQNELPFQKLPDSGNFKMRTDGFKGTNSYEILGVEYQYSFLAAAERSRRNWHGQPSF